MAINGEVFKILDLSTYRQTHTTTLRTNDGGFRVVGFDFEGDGFLVADVYDQDFNKLSSLNTKYFAPNNYSFLTVSATELSDGGYVMAWSNRGDAGEQYAGVYALIFNADGTPRGNYIQFSNEYHNERDIQLVGLNGGGFAITWVQANARIVGDLQHPLSYLNMQVVAANGSKIGSQKTLNSHSSDSTEAYAFSGIADKEPKIAMLKDGSFVVAWALESASNASSSGQNFNVNGNSVVVTHFSASGVQIGARITVGDFIGEPAIAALHDGGFVVAAIGVIAATQYNDFPQKIKAQIYDQQGHIKGGEFVVDSFAGNSGYQDISITTLKDGSFVIIWTSMEQDGAFGSISHGFGGGNSGIYGQKFSQDGGRQGGEFRVNVYEYDYFLTQSQASRYDEGRQTEAQVTALDNGGFLVSFENYVPDHPENNGLMGRMFGDGEVISGGVDELELTGTDRGDFITGSYKDNIIHGGRANDVIHAGRGDDTVYGGAGDDYISGAEGYDLIIDGLGNNVIHGQTENDKIYTFSGNNQIYGGSHNDLLIGGIHADRLIGDYGLDTGHDVLVGDASEMFGAGDFLYGGKGGDLMMGGKGADVFYFKPANSVTYKDVIAKFDVADIKNIDMKLATATADYTVLTLHQDFTPGYDLIELEGFNSGLTQLNVLNFVTDTVEGALFEHQYTSILLYDVDKADLSINDFSIL